MIGRTLERLQQRNRQDAAARHALGVAAVRIDTLRAELADAEARFRREADRRAAAEAAVADLEGKLTLAEETIASLRDNPFAEWWEAPVDGGPSPDAPLCPNHSAAEDFVARAHCPAVMRHDQDPLDCSPADASAPEPSPSPDPDALPEPPPGWKWRGCDLWSGEDWRGFVFSPTAHGVEAMRVEGTYPGTVAETFFEPTIRAAGARLLRSALAAAATSNGVRVPADWPGYVGSGYADLGRAPEPSPSPDPAALPELPAGWRWIIVAKNPRAMVTATEDWIISPEGRSLGVIERTNAVAFRWCLRTGWCRTASTRRAAGLALLGAAERERALQLEREHRLARDRDLPDIAAVAPLEHGEQCPAAGGASPGATDALGQRPFTETPVQAGSSVQGDDAVTAGAPVSRVGTPLPHGRSPVTPVQGATVVRSSRRLSARRCGTRTSGLTARESKGSMGNACQVAKVGLSLPESGPRENEPDSPRSEKPECTDRALTPGPAESEKPSRRSLVCDPGGELRLAVSLFGPVELVWFLAVKLAWLCGILGEREPGIRWLGIGWRAASVPSGALPTYWLGFAPPGIAVTHWTNDGWAWRENPSGPPFCGTEGKHDIQAPPGAVVVFREGKNGKAHWVNTWGAWRIVLAVEAQRELAETANLLRVLREDLADAEAKCPGCALADGDCWNACNADFARGEPIATALHEGAAAAEAPAFEFGRELTNTEKLQTHLLKLESIITDTARLCDQSSAAIRLGGSAGPELEAERLAEIARTLREELADALVAAPRVAEPPPLSATEALTASLVGIIRDTISEFRDCGGEWYGTDEAADALEQRLNRTMAADLDLLGSRADQQAIVAPHLPRLPGYAWEIRHADGGGWRIYKETEYGRAGVLIPAGGDWWAWWILGGPHRESTRQQAAHGELAAAHALVEALARAERAGDDPRVVVLATELESIVRGAIVYARNQADCYGCQECETERWWNDLADELETKLHHAQHPDQAPADTAAERGE